MALSQELINQLRILAQIPTLLVATDYDGTLAPLVNDPLKARPLRESSVALRSLATTANTFVAIISGRALRDLAALSRFPEEIHLVGSHGSEFDVGFVEGLSEFDLALLSDLKQRLAVVAEEFDGTLLEEKPAAVALHYRRCLPELHDTILAQAEAAIAELPGLYVKHGKMVLEVMVVQQDKGNALERLRHHLAAEAVIFLGDDNTDEEGFKRLTGPDIGIKVGEGETTAHFKVESPAEVSEILGLLSEEREKWVRGEGFPAIQTLSFLSNGQTTALLSRQARIVWLCHPRPDSSAVFAELLGGAAGGYFTIQPADSAGDEAVTADTDEDSPYPRQRYLKDTMSVETTWPTLTVSDYLTLPESASPALPYSPAPVASGAILHRVLQGQGTAVIEFSPRPDFGRSFPVMEFHDQGIVVWSGVEYLSLRSPGVVWSSPTSGKAVGLIELSPDTPVTLELRLDSDDLSPWFPAPEAKRAKAERHWQDWSQQLSLPSRWRDEVMRSALTLKGLCYEPTGAVLAAATTSLPEEIGGVRNWDYRFCWPRDAAMTVSALTSLGSPQEALDFLDWLKDRFGEMPRPDMLRPLYPVEGDFSSPEAVIPTLSGYRGSRPVRVGNAASHQTQHDMFGTLLDLMCQLTKAGGEVEATIVSDEMWSLVKALVEAVSRIWFAPDHGIWEARRPPRHHVHSKVMSWVALDRAVSIGEARRKRLRSPDPDEELLEKWRRLAGEIRADVLENGWNEKLNSYTVAYDDTHLDAAILQMGLLGMVEPTDERYKATVDTVERRLRLGPIVYRYRFDDGLPGFEGGFFICACWLVEALFQTQQEQKAEELFDRILNLLGPTGLLSEQYDSATQRHLGNYPQAYSHVGIINAALRLSGESPT